MTDQERAEMQQEALIRAQAGQSLTNLPAIYAGFIAKGIPEAEILPRENVFTYQAWLAVGRQVRRGEHGVRVTTFVAMTKKDPETGEKTPIGRHAHTATVFHVSQTDPARPQTSGRYRQRGRRRRYISHAEYRAQKADPCSDISYEERCAEAAGFSPFGGPDQ